MTTGAGPADGCREQSDDTVLAATELEFRDGRPHVGQRLVVDLEHLRQTMLV